MTTGTDGEGMLTIGLTADIEQVSFASGEVRRHMKGTVARQLAQVQAIELAWLAKLHMTALQAQLLNLAVANQRPGAVAIERQCVDVFQAPLEQRLIVQAQLRRAARGDDHITFQAGVAQVQICSAAFTDQDVTGQGAAADLHIRRAGVLELKQVAVGAFQARTIEYVDTGGGCRVHHQGRSSPPDHFAIVQEQRRGLVVGFRAIVFMGQAHAALGAFYHAVVRLRLAADHQQTISRSAAQARVLERQAAIGAERCTESATGDFAALDLDLRTGCRTIQ
ncbi:hypothetical protein D3C76_961900 [compost metagenome]